MNNQAGYQGVRVAVLGASGFIGRWVARLLNREGADLDLVVEEMGLAERVFETYRIQGRVYELDLAVFPAVREFLSDIKPKIVFNLAGYGVNKSERDEETAYHINGRLVGFLCESISGLRDQNWSGQDIVHVGSALEYGQIGGNLSEDSVPNPTTLYGKSKLEGTTLLTRYCRANGIKGLTARLFTVYGPGEHSGRLLPGLLETARSKRPLKLTSGVQIRDFTYVEDVAEGLLRIGLTATAAPGDVINLATGKLTSVRQFVHIAAEIMAIPLENLLFGAIPTEWEEMDHEPVSLDRLRALTAWVPETSVAGGIRKTLIFEEEATQKKIQRDA
jgi:nucleoside-diphosphate-sugar epimerase